MDKSLIDYLKQIPDCRDPHGLRHPLWLVLLIIIRLVRKLNCNCSITAADDRE